jgi:hypothetical protein
MSTHFIIKWMRWKGVKIFNIYLLNVLTGALPPPPLLEGEVLKLPELLG